jgi:hypothetical protein
MIRRRSFAILFAVVAAAAAAACNGSMTGPSGGGATISGRVTNVASAGTRSSVSGLTALTTGTPVVASNGSSNSTLKVTINGTNISTEIDGGGEFELNGVPPGTVEMTFSGDGVSATLRLTGIEEGDVIEIVVRLDGNRVMLDSERRDNDDDDEEDDDDNEGPGNGEDDDDDEVRGTVAGLTGTCPALTFTLGTRTVMTSSATRFRDACSRIQNGSRVEVEGRRTDAAATIMATEIELD